MLSTSLLRPGNTPPGPVNHVARLCICSRLHAKQLCIDRSILAGHRESRVTQRCSLSQARQSQNAQVQPRGSEVHVISNWNGTVELPAYDFGDQVLQEGSFGGDVLELQRFLHDQGYFPRLRETPDGYTGYFGDLTKEALQAWQEDYHLTANGQFGQSCRQAVARIQGEVQQQHMRQQQAVQAAPSVDVPARNLTPVQVGGFAFLMGGVAMFAYQMWAWWRHTQQAEAAKDAEGLMQDDREHQLGMWRGTISADRSYSSPPSASYANHSAPRTYGSAPRDYVRPPTPLVRTVSPPHSLARPSSTGASGSQPALPLGQDPSGPAVSLDGYPRYTPQWGVGLPEKKKTVPPTPIRKEPSERAKAVMTRAGTPPYPKPAGGGPKGVGSSPRAVPSERRDKRNAAAVVKPRPAVETRPRSPNPTAMPESLRKAPPLKPTLDPSAKSWIEIAVSQRGPSRNGKAGPRPGQAQGQGPQSRDQAFPGSQGSGVAQVLSVDQERQPGLSRSNRIGHGTGSNSSVNANRHNNGSGNGRSGQGNNGGNPSKGVSLFGSYKAPIKQQ